MVALPSDGHDDTRSRSRSAPAEVHIEHHGIETTSDGLPSYVSTTPSVATEDSYSIIVTPASDSDSESDSDWDNVSVPHLVQEDSPPAPTLATIQTRNHTSSRVVFGAPLEVAARISGTPVSLLYHGRRIVIGEIPVVIEICGEFIKEQPSSPGLFTISGSPAVISKLHSLYCRASHPTPVLASRPPTPHQHATLLLQYLHSLPSPMLPRSAIPWGVLTPAERQLVLDPPSLDPYNHAPTTTNRGAKGPPPHLHPLIQHNLVRTCEHTLACFYASFCRLPEANFALLFYMLDVLGAVFEGVAQEQERDSEGAAEERAKKLACVLASAVFHVDPGAMAGKTDEETGGISAGVVRARHLGQVLRFVVGFRGWFYGAVLGDVLAGL